MLFMRGSKHKAFLVSIFGVLLIAGIVALYRWQDSDSAGNNDVADHKDAAYLIDGQQIQLRNGISEVETAPDSASKITTRYFGNELKTDLDGDGREDVAFILTQERGGSGTFFYAVGALNTDRGYLGSEGYLLGDRIAPQATTLSANPRHRNVVVFNYADRATGEPMTAPPSMGKSVYLKLDPASRMWGIVEPDFEGESR